MRVCGLSPIIAGVHILVAWRADTVSWFQLLLWPGDLAIVLRRQRSNHRSPAGAHDNFGKFHLEHRRFNNVCCSKYARARRLVMAPFGQRQNIVDV